MSDHLSYLFVLFLSGMVPFGVSLLNWPWLKGYRWFNWSVVISAIPFVLWDLAAQAQGHWYFESRYISGLRLFGLPIEEYLFFLIIPQCCLLIWLVLNKYERKL